MAGGITLDGKDFLVVDYYNEVQNLVVNVTARVMSSDGQIIEHRLTIKAINDRYEYSASMPLGVGRLLSVSAHPTNTDCRRGQCFLYAYLARDLAAKTFPSYVLISDYLTTGTGLGFPFGALRSMIEGRGYIEDFTSETFGGTSNFSWNIPNNMRVRIMGVSYEYTASAVAGNRIPFISWTSNAGEMSGNAFGVGVIAPSATVPINAAIYGSIPEPFSGFSFIALPELKLEYGDHFAIGAWGADTNDTIDTHAIYHERWMIG